VDEESKDLLVINNPKRLFRYNRLPYGVMVTPAIFQSVMGHILHRLPVACCLDDILIAARTVKEHDVLLGKVLQKLQKGVIHLREEKVSFLRKRSSIWGIYLIDTKEFTHPQRRYEP